MSALPLMRRTAPIAAALAMLALAGVLNAQASHSVKTQRKPAARTTAQTAHRPSTSRTSTHAKTYTTRTHLGSHARLSSTRRQLTPEEAGREAGIAILRQRAGERAPRPRRVHVERRRTARRVRLEQAAWRTEERRPMRTVESGEAAGDDSAPETGQAEIDDAQGRESRRMSATRETMPATRAPEDNADAGTAAVDRMNQEGTAAGEAAAETPDDAAEQAGAETSAAALSRSGEGADSATARRAGDEASLIIPKGGMPLPLRGSLASLERQNDRLEAEGLERIEDETDLAARIADKLLVPIPISSALTVNPDLEENHRYCRPWTAKFLADLARAHEAVFHRSIEVSSAVRTVEYQKRLERTNGNAAPAEGDLVSPHLTGATVDIAKKGLSRAEMAWMRRRLMGLEAEGKIDVEEEFKQACFHITVYKSYSPAGKTGPSSPAKPVAERSRKLAVEPVAARGA